MERFSVGSCVRGQYRKPDPTNPSTDHFQDTKNYPCWGWLGLTCKTTQEATTSTNTFGRPVQENNYYANVRMATMLVCLLWWLSRGYTLGSSVLNERYWPHFFLVVLMPSKLLCPLPQPLRVGQLEKGDPVNQGHCQWGTNNKKRAITKRCWSKFQHVWKIS